MTRKRETAEQRRIRIRAKRVHQRVARRAREANDGAAATRAYDRVAYLARRVARWRDLILHPLWGAMFERVLAREPAPRIVAWLRPQLPEGDPLSGITDAALIRRIQRLRAALPPEALVPLLPIDQAHYRDVRIDVLFEMAGAIRYQKARIDHFAEVEKSFPFPVEQQRREVETLTEMLHQYWQAEVGMGLRPGDDAARHERHGR
jgi:hypothetical protein